MITPDNSFFTQQWGLYLIKVPQAWGLLNKITESNPDPNIINENSDKATFGRSDVRIAIIDTGIEKENNISVSDSFKGDVKNIDNTQTLKLTKHIISNNDDSFKFSLKDEILGSHGMVVAGISSAKVKINNVSFYDGNGVVGVAPNCPIYSYAFKADDQYFTHIFIMDSLAGIEKYSLGFDKLDVLSKVYEIIPKIHFNELENTDNNTLWLDDVLENNYTDVFNLSIGVSKPSQNLQNYSKAIFNEISLLGRGGRGSVIVLAAGNAGVDMEISPGNFFGSFAYSNKPIVVSAVSVNNNYNWIQGTHLPHPKKSDYSNFGNRIDICAPGGGAKTPNGQESNKIFTTTVRGAGELHKTPIIELNLKRKRVEQGMGYPPSSPEYMTHFALVELEFKNTNGIFAGQTIVFKVGTSVNYEELYTVASVSGKKIQIYRVKKSDYNNWTVSNTTVYFSPLYTKIEQINSDKVIKVESLKGVYIGAKIQIENLGESYNQINKSKLNEIKAIDETTNEITTKDKVTASIGNKVVFSDKTSNIVATSLTQKNVILDTGKEGFFSGCKLDLINNNGEKFYSVTVSKITPNSNNSQITIDFESEVPQNLTNVTKVRTAGFGDITPHFEGTSAATPFVSGVAALVLSANKSLSSAEVKHIIKKTADKIDSFNNPYLPNSDGYNHNINYGTGLVDAEAAVQLALDWHDPSKYGTTVVKPIMAMADRLDVNNNPVFTISPSDPDQKVSSPDIWVLPDNDTSGSTPTVLQPLNTLDTSVDQKIYIRVRNQGNRQSFKECDVRVFVAFTDDVDPAFPFPTKWYHQDDVKLLGIKEIPIILQNNETILEFEWKDIKSYWDTNNPKPITGLRKRAYILAHIAPFDGLDTELSLTNVRQNKQLTCKEIIVTHNGVSDRTAFLPGKKLDITVGQELVEKTFDLSLENILETDLATTKVKATKVNRADQSEVSVFFSKNTNDEWEIEGGLTPDWIEFETPDEIASQYDGYKHIKFPHTITVNNSSEEVKIETLNA